MFAKETSNVIKTEVKRTKEQVIPSLLTKISIHDMEVSPKPTLKFCMMDGKICNGVAGCESTQTCYLCIAKPNIIIKDREDSIKLGSKVDLESSIVETDAETLYLTIKDLERQVAYTEGKLAKTDKANKIVTDVCKENARLFKKIEEMSKAPVLSFSEMVQREKSPRHTRNIEPQKKSALVIRPETSSTHDETKKIG
ncbi:hypothetical protein AVEN_186185-1 [Araneus ventricosus]|uniref:Uncharacterized protein n=1 Tax=Araneus ventricosus TaxID=182803 RepID=A0A4Y2GH80_ARAVE|nr:hypothetical protein AVEN_186185-1 [Araneus ventricosus]